jgi:hypothetical protein
MFIRLIIRLFQLVFSAEIVFFSHNKSANSVFQPAYQYSRTALMYHLAEQLISYTKQTYLIYSTRCLFFFNKYIKVCLKLL